MLAQNADTYTRIRIHTRHWGRAALGMQPILNNIIKLTHIHTHIKKFRNVHLHLCLPTKKKKNSEIIPPVSHFVVRNVLIWSAHAVHPHGKDMILSMLSRRAMAEYLKHTNRVMDPLPHTCSTYTCLITIFFLYVMWDGWKTEHEANNLHMSCEPWNDEVSPVLPVASFAVYASGLASQYPDVFYFSCVWFIIDTNTILWQPFRWFAFFMLRHAVSFFVLSKSVCLSNLSDKC